METSRPDAGLMSCDDCRNLQHETLEARIQSFPAARGRRSTACGGLSAVQPPAVYLCSSAGFGALIGPSSSCKKGGSDGGGGFEGEGQPGRAPGAVPPVACLGALAPSRQRQRQWTAARPAGATVMEAIEARSKL